MNNRSCLLAGIVFFLSIVQVVSAQPLPSREEMWRIIQKQQEQIQQLLKGQKQVAEQAEAVSEMVEAQQSSSSGDLHSTSSSLGNETQLGGYGEIHYNGGDKDRIDFHRFVAFINHQYSDDLRFYSEIELEHAFAGEDQEGEVELEQAYIEYDLAAKHQMKTGVFLVPVGMLNERHEPTTFYGTERNPVETNIIPSTWREGGVGFSGELPSNFRYDLAVHSGLNVATGGDGAFLVRGGRQNVSEARMTDPAITARLLWKGISGVELGISGQYQNDVTQRTLDTGTEASLVAAHADIREGAFALRALYARWDLYGGEAEALGRDVQEGWFIEPSYRIPLTKSELGFFARYNQFDNEAGGNGDSVFEQVDFGLNFWPHKQVVFKADMSIINAPAGQSDDEIFNLGLGYYF